MQVQAGPVFEDARTFTTLDVEVEETNEQEEMPPAGEEHVEEGDEAEALEGASPRGHQHR